MLIDLIAIFLPLLLGIFLMGLGFFVGTYIERRHYKSIIRREKQSAALAVTSLKKIAFPTAVENAWLVSGSTVISLDYFKRFLAKLRNIIGGRVSSYETLVDRSRRESILRMKKQAEGADIIINMRIETSTIGSNANEKGGLGSIETLAYGTAIKLQK
ncbi:MAG: heavy metal-binding domain-containing protein [Candidatus Lindowbacteria bacterium]|nr:heavy metal-binding domain-containing protein [Candidatus Lindowbacteria bacterium]